MPLPKRVVAEIVGTFWLVSGGCGSAVLAARLPDVGLGYLGVAFAFGLSLVTMAYAIGHISGCHLNPAVSIGLVAGGRFKASELPHYISAQVLGAVLASGLIYCIASGNPEYVASIAAKGYPNIAANGFGEHSPNGYTMLAGFITEVAMTAMFLFIIMGATDKRAPAGLAPLAIGLTFTLIHMISIPVTNTSVNPARSTGPALMQGGWALDQLWLFWVAPIIGAIIGAMVYKFIAPEKITN
jgi:aquaporin Z